MKRRKRMKRKLARIRLRRHDKGYEKREGVQMTPKRGMK